MNIDIMFIAIAVFVGLVVIIFRQQRTIDKLTDKLMAKDYREYMSMQPREPDPQPEPTRKPLSWHDDPALDEDETH